MVASDCYVGQPGCTAGENLEKVLSLDRDWGEGGKGLYFPGMLVFACLPGHRGLLGSEWADEAAGEADCVCSIVLGVLVSDLRFWSDTRVIVCMGRE